MGGSSEAALPGAAIAASAAGRVVEGVVTACAAPAPEPETVAGSSLEQLAAAAVEAAVASKVAPASEGSKVAAAAVRSVEAGHSSEVDEQEPVTAICWTAATRSSRGGRGVSLSAG